MLPRVLLCVAFLVASLGACVEPKQQTPKDPGSLVLHPDCPNHPDYKPPKPKPTDSGGYGYEFEDDSPLPPTDCPEIE
jgi:hypothetical protein